MNALHVDAQLPPALARWLSAQGHEATHVAEHDLASAPDQEIWAFALGIGAVIVTKDEDFVRRSVATSGEKPNIVWLRFPNMRNQVLTATMTSVFPSVLAALARGEAIVEVI